MVDVVGLRGNGLFRLPGSRLAFVTQGFCAWIRVVSVSVTTACFDSCGEPTYCGLAKK